MSTEKEFAKKTRVYYEYYISDDNECIVIRWKDSKRVLLCSNHVGTQPETTVPRWDEQLRR